ncbi:MAG: M61 family metallopeptidase [Blastocatellia bacterium]|nr:M61 family metallopeptidase [Blastocatellia bacterium]
MLNRSSSRIILALILIWMVGSAPGALAVLAPEPIVYTVRFPAPETHYAEIEAVIPTHGRASIELMSPIWSPGFYRVEDYAGRIQSLTARALDGKALEAQQPRKNRWLIQTGGAPRAIVSYRLLCDGHSVTTNWVGDDLLVLNGAAAFVTTIEQIRGPYDVKLELPARWNRAMTALDVAPGGSPNHFRADDYDTLVDSPIVAGALAVREFDVDGSRHYVVDAGETGQWDGARAAQDLEKIVRETRRFWGFLPFKNYVFLNVFRQGGGGLEHRNSTLLTSSPRSTEPTFRWLSFVSHEYFHAFNVKRLRPVEISNFDYERPPQTGSLWISEGLTSYYGELLVCRAGLGSPDDCLAALSSHITQLQNSPGRLLQTLEESSLDVWNSGTSGVGRDTDTKVSYYVKGPVVGFLLDAKLQRATGGKKSLDDVLRLAYKRFSGARGFTQEQFRKTAEEVAGVDLAEWYRKAVSSVEELEYTEALEWFGLSFMAPDEQQSAQGWKLEIRKDATTTQKSRLRSWLGQAGQ